MDVGDVAFTLLMVCVSLPSRLFDDAGDVLAMCQVDKTSKMSRFAIIAMKYVGLYIRMHMW